MSTRHHSGGSTHHTTHPSTHSPTQAPGHQPGHPSAGSGVPAQPASNGEDGHPGHSAGRPAEPAEPSGHRHTGEPAADDGGGDPGDDGRPADPREGWMKGLLRTAGESAAGAAGGKAGDWAGDQVFGGGEKEPAGGEAAGAAGEDEGESAGTAAGEDGADAASGAGEAVGTGLGTGIGAAAGSMVGRMPLGSGRAVPGSLPAGGSEAYDWVRSRVEQQMEQLQPAEHASRGGLAGFLDEAVQYALEKSGLLDELEKVTGNLAELNAAAEEWQAQARAVQSVAEQVRSGAAPLPESWEGGASDSFGRHMGEMAQALDSTAEDMLQTARIINQAAQECALAEGMVIEIISEAIECLIASLAAEAVIAVLTAGIGLIADALITEAEIAVFVARVARVSTELASKLEELLKALKELGSAVKAVRNVNTARRALTELKNVKTAAQGLREFEEGGDGLGKLAKDAWGNRSLEGVGDGLKDYAVRQGVGKLDGFVTGQAEDGFRSALGIDGDDPVELGDGSPAGLGKAAGRSAWGAAKDALTSDTNMDAMKGELLNDTGLRREPAAYRVDASRIEQAFG